MLKGKRPAQGVHGSATADRKKTPVIRLHGPLSDAMGSNGRQHAAGAMMLGRSIGKDGKYVLDNELAEGGMGKVYLGEDTLTGTQVAVKIILPKFADDPDMIGRFKREIETAQRLAHRNVVSVLDSGEVEITTGKTSKGYMFYVMEYLEGKTLEERMQEGIKMRPDEFINTFIQVCEGMQELHNHGIIHRDLKPSNIFLANDGTVKIIDFGLAKRVLGEDERHKITKTGEIHGTPFYIAPEQISGRVEDYDYRADIYSLGVVLYELLCGKPPFDDSSVIKILKMHQDERPKHPVDRIREREAERIKAGEVGIPPFMQQLGDISMIALRKAPADRYRNMTEFKLTLMDVLAAIRGSGTAEHGMVGKPPEQGKGAAGPESVLVFPPPKPTAGTALPDGVIPVAGKDVKKKKPLWDFLNTAAGIAAAAITSAIITFSALSAARHFSDRQYEAMVETQPKNALLKLRRISEDGTEWWQELGRTPMQLTLRGRQIIAAEAKGCFTEYREIEHDSNQVTIKLEKIPSIKTLSSDDAAQ